MDKIREAFQSELSKGKLSERAKREIANTSKKSRFRFVPIVTVLICTLSLFIAWNLSLTDSPNKMQSTEQMDVKDLEQSIVNYTNELLLAASNEEFYVNVGESYPLRLALERNSGLLYSNGNLSSDEKMLLSQFLHYLQETHVLQLYVDFQSVNTIGELLQSAPQFVANWDSMLHSFKPIADEQKNPKFVDFSGMDWLVFVGAIVVSLYIIIRLWRNHYRVPPLVWSILLILFICGMFLNLRAIGYDETSMVKEIEKDLENANVRLSGEPTVEAIAGNSLNRYMLLSYNDGLVAVGNFREENGFFYYEGASWGRNNAFAETSTIGSGQFENVQLITVIMPKETENSIVKMDIEGKIIEVPLPEDRASIWMYRHDGKDIDFYFE